MKYLLRLFPVLALVLAFGWGSIAQAQGDNLLVNPSFESEVFNPISFDALDPNIYVAVPEGWGGAVIQQPRNESWQNIHPTGLPHIGPIKVDGFRSYHLARGGATFTAYIYQQVSVAPGTPVTGGAWAFIEGNTGFARVGIDPAGGTNPFEPRVVWSQTDIRNNWSTPTVNTVATGGTVTLFLYATQDIPTDPNGVYWDAAFLRGTAGEAPPPAPAEPQVGDGAPTPILRANVGRLNVRSAPGLDGDVLGIISFGEPYPVLDESGSWFGIEFGDRLGWVFGGFANVDRSGAPVVTDPVSAFAYTPVFRLRIRAEPTTESATLEVIPARATVEIIGRTEDGSWLQVRFGEIVGWSANGFGQVSGDLSAVPVTG